MFQEITYYPIFGKPLIMYLGALTLLMLLTTASVGILIFRGKAIPFAWHPGLAGTTIALALVHATLGFLAYL
jgi:hypothetical protein